MCFHLTSFLSRWRISPGCNYDPRWLVGPRYRLLRTLTSPVASKEDGPLQDDDFVHNQSAEATDGPRPALAPTQSEQAPTSTSSATHSAIIDSVGTPTVFTEHEATGESVGRVLMYPTMRLD